MRYRITTTLRQGIRDNAGVAVAASLNNLGFPMVKDVRIGKTFYIETDDDINEIAKKIVNPVMEDFVIETLDNSE